MCCCGFRDRPLNRTHCWTARIPPRRPENLHPNRLPWCLTAAFDKKSFKKLRFIYFDSLFAYGITRYVDEWHIICPPESWTEALWSARLIFSSQVELIVSLSNWVIDDDLKECHWYSYILNDALLLALQLDLGFCRQKELFFDYPKGQVKHLRFRFQSLQCAYCIPEKSNPPLGFWSIPNPNWSPCTSGATPAISCSSSTPKYVSRIFMHFS